MRNEAADGKSIVRKFMPMFPYETEAIQEYLEEMAQKGLIFKRRQGSFYIFRKDTPRLMKFYVDIYEGAGWLDGRPEGKTMDDIETGQEAGWSYLYSDGKFQFFCSDDMNASPFEADDRQRLRRITKVSLYNSLFLPLIWIFIAVTNLGGVFIPYRYNAARAWIETRMMDINLLIVSLLIGIMGLHELFHFLKFNIGNRIRIHKGKSIRMNTLAQAKRHLRFYFGLIGISFLLDVGLMMVISIKAGLIMFLVTIGIIGLIFVLSYIFGGKSSTRSRKQNRRNVVLGCFAGIGFGVLAIAVMTQIFIRNLTEEIGERVTYKENGETVTWYLTKDEIPYTIEDAGIKVRGNLYRDTSKFEDTMLFCKHL